jgi:hypothetical protein
LRPYFTEVEVVNAFRRRVTHGPLSGASTAYTSSFHTLLAATPRRRKSYTPASMIHRDLAAFLEGEVGIHLGTRGVALEPNGVRAVAVAVEEDGAHLVVYVASVAAARVIPDLRANGQAAVSFGRPVDDRACQVKGLFVEAREARADERPRVLAQWERFLANLEEIGLARGAFAGWTTWPCTAIRLRATALFEQTPRAGTGGPLA